MAALGDSSGAAVLPRRVGGFLLGVALAALSLAVSIDNTLGRRSPETATRWGVGGATAATEHAERIVASDVEAINGGSASKSAPARLDEAEKWARRALAREPVSVPAVRVLGQIAGLRNDIKRADRLFAYSEQLSRRDLPTQVWQIEAAVRRGEVAGALRHYDRALRTVRRAPGILYPVLVSAAKDPAVTPALAAMLAARPPWRLDFLAVMAGDKTADPVALGTLLARARLRADLPAESAPLATGLARLVAAGRYREADILYRRAIGAGTAVDAGFMRNPTLPPFDWSLAADTDFNASLDIRRTDKEAGGLTLEAPGGRGGEFARRLLVLAPGAWRLTFTASGAGSDPIARAGVGIACVNGRQLVQLPVAAVAPTRVGATLSVPADDCPAQWLVINAPAGLGEASNAVILRNLVVQRP